jgi:hypothetical protein
VKIEDGGQRVRPVVMAAALRRLGVSSAVVDQQLTAPVLGGGGVVGAVRATVLDGPVGLDRAGGLDRPATLDGTGSLDGTAV